MAWRNFVLAMGVFALILALFRIFPNLDLQVSGYFFRNGQWVGMQEPWLDIREIYYRGSIFFAIYIAFMALTSLRYPFELPALFYRFFTIYAFLCNYLLINLGFKEIFGRARPYKVTEFGGQFLYTPPPLMPVHQCDRNCSFVSGEASGAVIMMLGVGALFGANRAGRILVLLLFLPMAILRVVSGWHFLSDVLLSMALTFAFYWLMLAVMHKNPSDLWGSFGSFFRDFGRLWTLKFWRQPKKSD